MVSGRTCGGVVLGMNDPIMVPRPHCEVCAWLADETCDRHPIGSSREEGQYGGDDMGDDGLFELEEMERRLDTEWEAYLLRRHGLRARMRIVDRRPSCILRQRRWVTHACGYYGPQYRFSCNGYMSNK
mgnify:CR=1 FL=1